MVQEFRATVLRAAFGGLLLFLLLDEDAFDQYCEILMVFDGNRLVGTYRFLRYSEILRLGIQFYSAGEFDLSPVLRRAHERWLKGFDTAEVGRSCVLDEEQYRNGSVIRVLWLAIAEYQKKYNIDAFFGCASFNGTDTERWNEAFSYLRHYHIAPEEFRVRALESVYQPLGNMTKEQLAECGCNIKDMIPPLVHGYTFLGGWVGDGVFVDKDFNSVDVFIYVIIEYMNPVAYKYYFRPRSLAKA
jgi:putative hemolysin